MGDVVRFEGVTTLDIDPDLTLEAAMGKLEQCVVVGHTKEGDFYFSSSVADSADVVWFLERAKHKLMTMSDKLENGE